MKTTYTDDLDGVPVIFENISIDSDLNRRVCVHQLLVVCYILTDILLYFVMKQDCTFISCEEIFIDNSVESLCQMHRPFFINYTALLYLDVNQI